MPAVASIPTHECTQQHSTRQARDTYDTYREQGKYSHFMNAPFSVSEPAQSTRARAEMTDAWTLPLEHDRQVTSGLKVRPLRNVYLSNAFKGRPVLQSSPRAPHERGTILFRIGLLTKVSLIAPRQPDTMRVSEEK